MNMELIFLFFADYPILGNEKSLPLYLQNMGHHHCQDHLIRPEGYHYDQILYCTKGSGTLIFENKAIPIPHDTAIFIPAETPHEYYPEEDIWDIHWIVPCGYAAKDILTQFGLTELKTFHLSDTKMLEHIFRKMHNALRTDSIFGNYKASGYLYDFLMEFYRLIAYKDPATSVSSALMKALDYINYNYFSPITMGELCSVSGVTKQHLCLLFRKKLSMRPMEYIAKRRIQEAKALLTGTEKSIEQVAEETGFCSESYFCKLFKRYEGMTPSLSARSNNHKQKKSRPKAAQLCRKLALLLHLSETLTAVNRSVLSWLERNNSLAAARSTSCCISLSFRLCSSLSCISASFTSLWLVYETFLSIELLLACCENELVSALLTY